jgi:hypothetical protein
VLKFLARKLLSPVVAFVVKYIGPLESYVRLSWWVVFSHVMCFAARLVLEVFRNNAGSVLRCSEHTHIFSWLCFGRHVEEFPP